MPLKKLRNLFLVFLCTACFQANAQQYGFEWIRTGQSYYKFYIASEGVARIYPEALQAAGINTGSLDPSRLQVFRNGREVPLYIRGESDGLLNTGDFIELYVEKNNGDLDSMLYAPNGQPHRYYSLFTDTACYFITILPASSPEIPLRYTVQNDANTGSYTAEDYFTAEAIIAPANEYLDGPNMASSETKYITSDYEKGEGWAGLRVGQGSSETYMVSTPDKINIGSHAVQIKVIGASDARRNINNQNHHFILDVSSNNSSYTNLVDHKYAGYDQPVFNLPVSFSDIGNTTYFRLQTLSDIGVVSDFNCLSYIRLLYNRGYNWSGSTFKRFSAINTKGGAKTRIDITAYGNGSAVSPTVLDLTSRHRVNAIYSPGTVSFLLSNDNKPHDVVLFDSSQVMIISQIKPVTFNSAAFAAGGEYVMITHPVFEQAATNYAQYRSLKFSVMKVFSDDLYDYYFYGVKHPIAIRNFAGHLVNHAVQKPKYMLLAGRGYQNDKIRVAVAGVSDPRGYYNRNYVPALGMPAADALFTSGLTTPGGIFEIPVGRIPALTNEELQNYLDKLIYYETTPDSLPEWHKNVVHVSGGNDQLEQQRFTNQINKNKLVIEKEFVGANVISFNKNTSESQQKDLKEKIVKSQNDGVLLFTFLGHASLTILDVDMGGIGDLNNKNKYPFYYFNGCNVGNAAEVDIDSGSGNIYAKDYLCQPDKGAIGWLAHSNFTFDGTLYSMMDAFYNRYCVTDYRLPVGNLMKKVGDALNTNDAVTRSHVIQWQLQGDPALVVDNAALPDYRVASNDLFTTPANITLQEDSFAVNVIVTNLGKATGDTVEINLRHAFPNGNVVNWPVVRYKPVYLKDTFTYWLRYSDTKPLLGNNRITVSVDAASAIEEGNENNNSDVFDVFISGSGVSVLLPVEYGIINTDSVTLIAQNNNTLIREAEYIFELDTVPAFNSPAFISSGVISAGAIASWKTALPLTDTTAFYWRVRLNQPVNQGGQWDNSSFSKISNGGHGFAQVRFDQIKDLSANTNIQLNTDIKRIEFTSGYKNVKALIGRWAHGGMGVLDPYFNTPQVGSCIGSDGFVCVLFDKNTLTRTTIPGFPTNCNPNQGGTIYNYYAFNTENATGQNELIRFLDSVPAGYYVAGFSYYYCGADVWSQALRDKLAEVGLNKVSGIASFYNSFSFVIRKGVLAETVEDTIYDPSGVPGVVTSSEMEMEGKGLAGEITSAVIGPADDWFNCRIILDSLQSTDEYALKVFGVRSDLSDSLLMRGAMTDRFDLSGVDAQRFPFLKLGIELKDTVNRSPLQPERMIVNYEPVTELTFDASTKYEFHHTVIEQGDSLRISVAVKNVSQVQADSVDLSLTIMDPARVVVFNDQQRIPALNSGEIYIFSKVIPTVVFAGANEMNLVLNNTRKINEVSFLNNFIRQPFEVKVDQTNPLMDVTFDGYRIMNGDFVSPQTVIRITSKDDNKFRIQNDTSTFNLFLKRPNTPDFERIFLSDASVSFIGATQQDNTAVLEFRPGPLTDGEYALSVISKDATGNVSGDNAYGIEFNVVNESTITNFYPYPNPGTTNIRFVFTLTGGKAPERLLIRIMTVTGKIVKEITEQDFGPIKIGNNISQYGWDGTDNFGDRLANGVYLYQVFTHIDGQSIKKRETDADKYVMHNTGKIYLLK